jgi:hypothetical protein
VVVIVLLVQIILGVTIVLFVCILVNHIGLVMLSWVDCRHHVIALNVSRLLDESLPWSLKGHGVWAMDGVSLSVRVDGSRVQGILADLRASNGLFVLILLSFVEVLGVFRD